MLGEKENSDNKKMLTKAENDLKRNEGVKKDNEDHRKKLENDVVDAIQESRKLQ